MKESASEKKVVEAKQSFNKLLKMPEYQTIISDDAQRKQLIKLLRVKPKSSYLDLATGAGYVGFAIAEQYPNCSVIGLDIANDVIIENQKKVKKEKLTNIDFESFNGVLFPAFEVKFDGVICRYALHHFPEIDVTLKEINKVLKIGGKVVIADAIRNEYDNEDFINRFQSIKKDGHVRMYTRNEILSLFSKYGFHKAETFYSKITFSCELNPQYEKLLKSTSQKIKEKYSAIIVDTKVTLTFNVFNVGFNRES